MVLAELNKVPIHQMQDFIEPEFKEDGMDAWSVCVFLADAIVSCIVYLQIRFLQFHILNLLPESDHNAIWSVVDVTDGQGETFPLWGNKYPNWNKNELMTRKNLRNVAQKYTAIIHSVKDGISRMTLKAEKLPRNRTRKN